MFSGYRFNFKSIEVACCVREPLRVCAKERASREKQKRVKAVDSLVSLFLAQLAERQDT